MRTFASLVLLLLLAVPGSAQRPASGEKVRVILDTDAFNEIDDQFFIAYSLWQKNFDLEGITAAQYRWEQGSVDESYFEIRRVLRLMNLQPSFPVVRGSDVALKDERTPVASPATELIIRAARKQEPRPLYILAVGALTNVASALLLAPEIRTRVRVIWLGGFPPEGEIKEFNAANDRAAVKAVFESGVDLTVVPTETSARYLTLPYGEAEQRLRHTNALGEMLLGILRDYGDRKKVIWDISTTAVLIQLSTGRHYFPLEKELAPRIDLAAAKYVRRQGPHSITVTGRPDRDAVFADFFRYIPKPADDEPPYLLGALGFPRQNLVRALFSEPVQFRTGCLDRSVPRTGGVRMTGPAADLTLTSGEPRAEWKTDCAVDAAGNTILPERNGVTIHSEPSGLPGLRWKTYAAGPDLKAIPAVPGKAQAEGVVSTLDWPSSELPAASGPTLLRAEGLVYLPLDHRYTFELHAAGLTRIWLGEELLLDLGAMGDRASMRTTFRRAGVYPLRIEQYIPRGAPRLTVLWNMPFHDKTLLPDALLLHRQE